MRDRVGYAAAPELDPLKTMLKGLDQVMPREGGAEPVASGGAGGDAEPAAAARRGGGAGLTGAIDTRNDALRAIDMVCEYLERAEPPTNPGAAVPAPRAPARHQEFLMDFMKVLAPDALSEVPEVDRFRARQVGAE